MRLTKTLATACAWLSFGTGCLSYRRLRYSRLDVGVLLYLIKLMAGALAPILSVLGLVGVAQGLLSKMPLTALAGGIGALLSAHYVRWVAAPTTALSGLSVRIGATGYQRGDPRPCSRAVGHVGSRLCRAPM